MALRLNKAGGKVRENEKQVKIHIALWESEYCRVSSREKFCHYFDDVNVGNSEIFLNR